MKTTNSTNKCSNGSEIYRCHKNKDNKSHYNEKYYNGKVSFESNFNQSICDKSKVIHKNTNCIVFKSNSTEELHLVNRLRKNVPIQYIEHESPKYIDENAIKENRTYDKTNGIEIRKKGETTPCEKSNDISNLRDSFISKLEAPKSFLYQILEHRKQTYCNKSYLNDNAKGKLQISNNKYQFESSKEGSVSMEIPLSGEHTPNLLQNLQGSIKNLKVLGESSFLNSRIAEMNTKFSKIMNISKQPIKCKTTVESSILVPPKKSIEIFSSVKENDTRLDPLAVSKMWSINDTSKSQNTILNSCSYVPMDMHKIKSKINNADDKSSKPKDRRVIYDVLLKKQKDLALEDRGYYDVQNNKEKSNKKYEKSNDNYHGSHGEEKITLSNNESDKDNAYSDNVYEELEIECLPQSIDLTKKGSDRRKLAPLERSPNSWNLCHIDRKEISTSKSISANVSFNSIRKNNENSRIKGAKSYETIAENKITKIIDEIENNDTLLEYDCVDVISPKYYAIPEYGTGMQRIESKGRFNITKVNDLSDSNVPSIEVEEYLEPITLEPDYCDVDLKCKEETIVGAFLKKFEYNSKAKENIQKSSEESKRNKEVTNQPIPIFPPTAAKPPRDGTKHPPNSKASYAERPLEALQKWNESFRSSRWKRGTSMADRPLPVPVENEFYYMEVSRTNAEKLLEGHADGTFILRPSSKAEHAYTLTLVYGGQVYNIGCRKRSDNRLALGYPKPFELTFLCIKDLIEHYYREKIILISNGVKIGSTPLRKLNC